MSSGEGRDLLFDLDAAVFRLAAVKKAAYKFGGRCHIDIRLANATTIRVVLRPKTEGDATAALAGEFRNEVLDQELREVVGEETQAVRNLILAQAFSRTSLLDPPGETADYRTDPLGIAGSPAADGGSTPTTG